ncbi:MULTISPECIES: flagellar basal body-associated FliL family protein [Thioalkalivibrio]|uniref:Flagellar protein FliL n=1 Tax=Thioalkalivibrio halophilus TaxID=252474 RepID=A0A1V3A1Y4_9GAMM|nr:MULTISPECIES: flagellar basal body-associated FliL family protein [Thioalkalivibrio]OOC11346.1 flagellar basal body-associated protein FliL [Thioalkalivibrio halophilus]
MAEKEVELENKGGGGKKWMIIILLVVAVLLAGGGGAAAWFLLSQEADETAEDLPPERHYSSLDPMTVNIDAPGSVQFLRVQIGLVSTDPAVLEAVEDHLPVVRNDILGVLSDQEYTELNTREGKEALAEDLTATVRVILESREAPFDLERVVFTELVMQ